MQLDVDNLVIRAQERLLLDHVALSVAPGELVGLIGPNGAGKTTLLRAIVGSQRIAEGSVRLDGRAIDDFDAQARARALAYLPQDRQIEWPLPVTDIVMLGRYPHRSRLAPPDARSDAVAARALAAVDAASLSARRATVLSGGERTRVLLARALAVEAPLLLVDEPVAGLDPYHQLHVMEILRDTAHSGTGVLAVLHDLTLTMRFMDRVVLLHNGRIAAHGAPADVLTPANLRDVYRISTLEGINESTRYVLPWSRLGNGTPT
jgi:iron complex transport system ATP-binding protein